MDESQMENVPLSGDEDFHRSKKHQVNSKGLDVQDNIEAEEDKTGLITQVLGLQSTLDDLSQRVDAVKDENLKLKSENQVLGQYIENLMAASNVFQATGETKGRRASTKSNKKR